MACSKNRYSKGLQPLVLKLCLDILVIASARRGCGNLLFPVLYEIASVTSFLTLKGTRRNDIATQSL